MSRLVPPTWILTIGAVALLAAGFGYADKTRLHWYADGSTQPSAAVAAPAPDRVVGVIRRCAIGASQGTSIEEAGDNCASWKVRSGVVVVNDRLEATVRTGQGTTYLVTLPVGTAVSVGDQWPPK